MENEKGTATVRTRAAQGGDEEKETLQRKMEETRDSIAQTVSEIKETVTEQYESVKDSVAHTLDWREQFHSHPVAWCFGALSVGYVIGSSVAATF